MNCINDFDAVFTTPTGLNIKAQGCAYPRYPGKAFKIKFNPNGVEHYREMCNPVGVVKSLTFQPRVARIRATLGFDVKPFWGYKTENKN